MPQNKRVTRLAPIGNAGLPTARRGWKKEGGGGSSGDGDGGGGSSGDGDDDDDDEVATSPMCTGVFWNPRHTKSLS